MTAPVITSGDDVLISATLYKDGLTFTIAPTADVKAAVISRDNKVLIGPVAQSDATTGADWANSLVMVEFKEEDTVTTFTGKAEMEIQVDDGGKQTFFTPVSIRRGNIA